jgi:hypothetical protein
MGADLRFEWGGHVSKVAAPPLLQAFVNGSKDFPRTTIARSAQNVYKR